MRLFAQALKHEIDERTGMGKMKAEKHADNQLKEAYPVIIFSVPFCYSASQYSHIVQKYSHMWDMALPSSDNEFFSHIQALTQPQHPAAIASRFVRRKIDAQLINAAQENTYQAAITDVELYLFKTGVGFYCFQVRYSGIQAIQQIVERNNTIKSIAHHGETVRISEAATIPYHQDLLTSKLQENAIEAVNMANARETVYLNAAALIGLDRSHDVKITLDKDRSPVVRYKAVRETALSDFINDDLCELQGLSYFNEYAYGKGHQKSMAKKANLFVSCLQEEGGQSEASAAELGFLMARGYKGSYKKTSFSENEFFATFDNSFWCVSREGAANIVRLVDDEKTNLFFIGTYLQRIQNYFFLYLLALHQYYGLINAANAISCLPSSIKDYMGDAARENYNAMIDTYDAVNYLYLKCIYHEVTHISHQAEFYRKIYDMLGIEALLTEVNYEMDRLTSIVNYIRDNQRVESYRKQQEQWAKADEERAQRKEVLELEEIENKKREEQKALKEKKYAIIGSIFAFFSVFEAIWNIAILSNVKSILKLGLSDTLIEISVVFGLLILSVIIGMTLYSIWNKKEKQ